jgi:hypothetical protein
MDEWVRSPTVHGNRAPVTGTTGTQATESPHPAKASWTRGRPQRPLITGPQNRPSFHHQTVLPCPDRPSYCCLFSSTSSSIPSNNHSLFQKLDAGRLHIHSFLGSTRYTRYRFSYTFISEIEFNKDRESISNLSATSLIQICAIFSKSQNL